ncbi:ATP-binding cassette sub-family C member 4-like [Lycorma delicatula]|uniref:ATP-binding cassette sub-family C member 4-like n=1 Tax=Lycorma delicatula TaxID=130591 RepID=UPI003F5179DF
MDASNRKAPDNPKEQASCISSLFFIWTYKILRDGYHRVFDIQDICKPLKEDYSNVLGDRIEKKWQNAIEKARNKNKVPSLFTTILKTFGKEYTFLALIHVFCEVGIQLARPYFLGLLLSYFKENSGTTINEAYFAAAGISLCSILYSVLGQHYLSNSLRIGMKVRVACVSLVYRKCLKLGRTALGDISPGQVVNLVSNDVSRFEFVTITCHYMWSAPLLAAIIAVILFTEIRWAGLIGILVVFIVVPLLSYVGSLTSKYRLRIALKTDERVRLTDEVINGIQVIKMYAWEKPFSKLITAARKAELDIVKKTSFLRGLYMTFNLSTTRVALFSALLAIVLSGDHLSADKVFVIAAYFGSLTQTFSGMFVRGFAEISECRVSIRRLQSFLLRDEYKSQVKLNYNENDKNNKVDDKAGNKDRMNKVFIEDVSASWHSDSSDPPTLNSISCTFKHGTVVGVIGSVGSGKSSFLQLLLGEIAIVKGNIEIRGTVSYASQEAWVFAGSVRQNILFGQPYDRKRYKQVTKVCALERDFELLPHGDMTLVGERGASLSGGQKARVNLARAVYREADVYLLDDPLSAVDTHVGKHLFTDCIKGFLGDKTVILVTHQLQYINNVDHVILLHNGKIETQGSFSELKNSGLDYASLVSSGDERKDSVSESEHEELPKLTRMISKTSIGSLKASTVDDVSINGNEPVAEREPEVVKRPGHSVYLDYFRAGSNICTVLIIAILFIFTQVIGSCADYFVSYWTRLEERRFYDENAGIHNEIWPSTTLASIHGSLVAGLFVFALIRATIFCATCMSCSNGLHSKMFNSVIGTSISFFNNNPSGRILNRFSKDLGMIDEWLPKCLLDVCQSFCGIIGSLIVAIIVNPLFIIPAIILGILSVFVRRFYIKTSKNVKRLEGIARSPVFSHLNSTLQGLPTIRALGAQKILLSEFDNHQDLHTGAMFLFIYTSSGFSSILDMLCFIFITCVTFSFLVFKHTGVSGVGASAGLAITQSLSVAGLLQWGMRASAEIANQMTSTERVLEYATLPSEEPDPGSKKGKEDVSNWPTEGRVQFSHLFLCYSSDDPPVLKDVCLEIKPREKVGIVGRTGAGKSSLIQALFRMSPIEGQILIDGVDTKTLTLECLRSHISIIPQDPVLYSGTMRRNLDPFEEYPDYILWKALEEVELRESLKDEFGLQTRVMDGGSNFSLGQRQLVCLARAIVRNNKVLVMDEATANVDPQTDALIQKTIRDKFSDCTVLTIAHRLNTVMDSDKVLVMDAGKAVEFDHPYNLLKDSDGYFFKLVQETGSIMSEQLAEIAKANYLKR